MKITTKLLTTVGLACLFYPVISHADDTAPISTTSKQHVNSWNQFAERLYILHQHQISQGKTFQKESISGYMGAAGDSYREIKYYDAKTKRLLSRVLWEKDNPEQAHEIEVFVYDGNGKLKRDYLAVFLPVHRNAPVQTLINFHHQNDELKSFRQFDASGEKIYERCEGRFFNEPLNISFNDDDFAQNSSETMKVMESEEYLACFGSTIASLGDYVNPLFGLSLSHDLMRQAEIDELDSPDSIDQKIKKLTKAIKSNTTSAKNYYKRGMAYLQLRMFDEAVEDFSSAIKLDDSLDGAYFGRGLAFGRLRMFDEGIADLSIFIKRNPRSSVAYTKRGVRRIWAGKYNLAEEDLNKAILLNPKNAEAHDDLGVMDARRGDYKRALWRFKKVVNIDPTYSKGFHNKAMTHFILGHYNESLTSVNEVLKLKPNDKNALLLKGETMLKLGMIKEAKAILDKAEFLPEGGWQESFSLQTN